MNLLNFRSKPAPHDGEQLLKKFQDDADKAISDYKSDNFSGHPEEQLELIDVCKSWVKRGTAAKERSWQVDKKSIEDAKEALALWEEVIPVFRGTDAVAERITKQHLLHIEWAEKGLI